jgi:hypothetical protein
MPGAVFAAVVASSGTRQSRWIWRWRWRGIGMPSPPHRALWHAWRKCIQQSDGAGPGEGEGEASSRAKAPSEVGVAGIRKPKCRARTRTRWDRWKPRAGLLRLLPPRAGCQICFSPSTNTFLSLPSCPNRTTTVVSSSGSRNNMTPEYKAQKEAAVSFLGGGGIWEINHVALVAPVRTHSVAHENVN